MATAEQSQLAEQIYFSEVEYREVFRRASNIIDSASPTESDLAQLVTYQQQLQRDETILNAWLAILRDGGMTLSEFRESVAKAHAHNYDTYAAECATAQCSIDCLQLAITNDTPDAEELVPYATLSDGTVRWTDIEAQIAARDRRRLRNAHEMQVATQILEHASIMRDHCAQTEGSPIWQL